MRSQHLPKPALYVVATPIGNLDDFSPRGIAILKHVDFVACEDTRTAHLFLNHFSITTGQLVSYHDYSEQEKAPRLIKKLKDESLSAAIISEAGTPGISDPGYRLVSEAHNQGVRVIPIPGPCAFTALACASGLPTNRLLFIGFLPTKANALKKEVESWRATSASILFYESGRRLRKTMTLINEVYPHAQVAVGRELTKLHEEILRSSPRECLEWIDSLAVIRGELSVMVHVPEQDPSQSTDMDVLKQEITQALREGMHLKDILKRFQNSGLKRGELYQFVLTIKHQLFENG